MMDRDALLSRWLELTRTVLPGMARVQAWPIHDDHCFMRVFLDHAMQDRWDRTIPRPAIRHMPTDALARAVEAAERTIETPNLLPRLNTQSLSWRRRP